MELYFSFSTLKLSSYPRAVKMLSAGTIDVKPLITHSYPLKNAVDAFEHVKSGRDGAIKVLILG
jgi:L-iditol 2-dehydrogenase